MTPPRWPHRVYAFLAGYFWLPCPICLKMFGGHEVHGGCGGTLWAGDGTGRMTCPDCPGDWEVDDARSALSTNTETDDRVG